MSNSPTLLKRLKLNRRQCLRSLGMAGAAALFPALPAYEPVKRGPGVAADLPAWTAEHPLLYVDDYEELLELVDMMLTRRGWRIITASHGASALKICRQEPVSLVVSDIMMPEISGYEMYTRMKVDPIMGNIPLIYCSTLSDPKHIKIALELGAIDYITMPFTPEEFIYRIEHALLAHGRWGVS